ncbi:TetR/AcrR family transcriptional regulator [Williamsia phyllosphaerae]|uniref:TetR family transcriptional regulator n=1 Tax=Williamsia phyllosphaerae TaxID=885042 RepID=A0ABQ1UNT4_9NOCA|nr:TetR/AcrR family transcriptional regulator [Williamsia phyllosphaerae]GGF21452.1 TetR family transcriptional regulator [Williamsia phyllosphaerae]
MRPESGPAARGRPRLVEQRRTGGNPREEILDAAGELFTTQGFAGTSTRAIAESVGMRQASLYHHFATKDDILAALLQDTVAPALDVARSLDPSTPAITRLLDLIRYDAGQLAASRWNLGALYLLPELRGERFTAFRDVRVELREVYRALSVEVVGDPADGRVHLPFRLVESVISMRSDGLLTEPDTARGAAARASVVAAIADAAERLLR